MLSYFPQIYPGELLYSVLARYHRHMGAPSPIQSIEALFGRRLIVASVDLPGYLQALADRLPPGFGWTADRIIDELTLQPYYTAFQPPSVERLARKAMLRGQTDGLLMRLGMAAFRVGRVTRLRFCSLCLQQMREQYGECYWRRDHQLPGVLACPNHGHPLQASTVLVTKHSRHIYITANQKSCPWKAPALVGDRNSGLLSNLQRIAQASRSLLENPGPAKSQPEWTKHYRQGIQRIGLAHSAQRVNQQRLQEQFRGHHRGLLAYLPGLMVGQAFRGGWLLAMVRKHRKAFHPLQHVLLQDFLVHQEEHSSPFGGGPWHCLNPLAKHRGKPRVSKVELHRNQGHQVGVFACECGYVYTRSYYDGSGKAGAPRFKAYGPMLAPVLGELISIGLSLRAVAHRLELDPKTVVKLANELKIATPWKLRTGAKVQTRAETSVALAPPTPRSERIRAPARRRLDWSELDKEISRQVQQAAEEIRRQTPPVRVSTLRVECQCWNRGWLSKRAEKLTSTMTCLSSVVESIEQFQRRRAAWVIRQMDKTDEPLLIWRILRKAGLTSRHEDVVVSVLNEYFGNHQRQAS